MNEMNESQPTMAIMVGIKRASELTGYTVNYLYKLTHKKLIKHYKPRSGRIFFKIQELEEFMCRGVVLADYDIEEIAEQKLLKMKERKIGKHK